MRTIVDCSAETLFPNAKATIFCDPKGYAVNCGGPGGLNTKSPVWAVAPDPLEVPGCCMVLTKFLNGSPVAVRYDRGEVYKFNVVHWGV